MRLCMLSLALTAIATPVASQTLEVWRDVGNNCPNTFCTFESVANLSAAAAAFGPAIASPISGYAVFSDPVDGCTPLRNKVSAYSQNILVQRGGCEFGIKVYHAQQAGYTAAVVYNNVTGGPLVKMQSQGNWSITIPSAFIAAESAVLIQQAMSAYGNQTIAITLVPSDATSGQSVPAWAIDLIIIGTVLAVVTLLFFMWYLGRREAFELFKVHHAELAEGTRGNWVWYWSYPLHPSRPPLREYVANDLLQSRALKSEDIGKACAVCCNDFSRSTTITDLSCGHTYHLDCIKAWVMDSQGLCPVCGKPMGGESHAIARPARSSRAQTTRQSDDVPLLKVDIYE
eukprot:m.326206 g.326206  ORF g.326206 m.326206 type:complete len:343 (-) comp16476_c1_seq8:1436-2464(-)